MFNFNLFNLLASDNHQHKEPLSDASKQLLSQQTFTPNQPNPIVQDFETFIEFLQLHQVEVSANQNAIAPKYLADLNSRLIHPTKIDFQRPSQKSYHYIHGLYLLLRASAITQVQLDKKKNLLNIDPLVLKSWQELNDAFNFYNDHLHQFTYKDRQGFKQSITHPYSQEPPSTDEVLIRDWQIGIGDRLTYVFDFGDWWEFNVVLESIDEPNHEFKKATVIDQKGKAPKQYPDYDDE